MQSSKLSEQLAVVGKLASVTVVNSEVFTDVVDMGAMQQALAILNIGNVAAETVDFKCYSCDSDGNNAVAITGRTATQLAAHATNNDSKQVLINVRDTDLLASGKQHVKFGVVTGGAAGGPMGITVLGKPRQGLANANDLASVLEIVG